MRATHLAAAVLFGAALVSTIPLHAAAQEPHQPPPSIQVTGEATVTVQPDQVQIEIGVVTQAEKSEAAASRNAQQLDKVLADLRGVVGPEGKVQTIGYSLRPDYRYPGQGGGEPTISGYTATNVVRVTLNDLTRVARAIDAATGSGANRIQALRFELKDESPVLAQALREAASRARAKADALAAALNLQIVRVLSVSESGGGPVPVVPVRDVMFARAEAAAPPTPIEPGTVEVRATVNLVVEVRGS
ncbi:MAG TPA: SIMPL domain-containing protein [Vicinamibacterales bacterium]|nr:SIMPL domain-containing protein [Acidobacteriota bacterium]HOC18690.1 SIMPL domain-containing protein [Vicinamibacterales bacterium]